MIVLQIGIMVFGAVIGLLCLWGIYSPKRLIDLVKSVMDRDSGIYAAVITRVVLGIVLIAVSPSSRFPTTFYVLGVIAIVAAIGLAIMGRARLRGFIGLFDRMPSLLMRLWLVIGIAFGAFLVHGVY